MEVCLYLKDKILSSLIDGGMTMIHFDHDYAEGAHQKILERLIETNMEQAPGYGLDEYTKKAQEYIKESCGNEDIDVHLLSAGTQTNLTVIAASLRPHQGVISAESGHIQTLETGAIESVGHKIVLLPSEEGKIAAEQVEELCKSYWNDKANIHKVQPGMLYLANPTEVGTLYTKKELEALSQVSKKYDLKFFIDGARLGYGLVSEANDVTLEDITELTDVFYIGGTKIGALFGEAVVIKDPAIQRDFRSIMKQKGALLAKGRALGVQFETLFKDNLYFDISKYAVEQAMRIKEALLENNISLKFENDSNQLFPVFSDEMIAHLEKNFKMLVMDQEDNNHHVVRICTSWATTEENVDYFISEIAAFN